MIIIHDMDTLPRAIGRALADRLRVMPAVVLTGARQTGKSTLAEELIPGKRRYATLDDLDVFDAATRDPDTLVGGSTPVTLDEIQRVPALLRAVKRAIDRDRRPGRFLLTGSANLLLMRDGQVASLRKTEVLRDARAFAEQVRRAVAGAAAVAPAQAPAGK